MEELQQQHILYMLQNFTCSNINNHTANNLRNNPNYSNRTENNSNSIPLNLPDNHVVFIHDTDNIDKLGNHVNNNNITAMDTQKEIYDMNLFSLHHQQILHQSLLAQQRQAIIGCQDPELTFLVDTVEASKQFFRRLWAEFIGTWILTMLFAGLGVEYGLGHVNQAALGLGFGLTIMALIYSLGSVSGCHINPLISLAFTIRRTLPVSWLCFYWCVQFAGSLCGAGIVRAVYADNAYLGTNAVNSAYSVIDGLLMESLITTVFIFIVIQCASQGALLGPDAALPIGAAASAITFLSINVSSSGFNWWRTFGPAAVSSSARNDSLWIFFVGPLIGCILAVIFGSLITGKIKASGELNSAQGQGELKRA